VSRKAAEAPEAALRQLRERGLDEIELLIIHLDSMHFGHQSVLAAVRVGVQGCKHLLA
jgi:hypothetical protein